MRTRTPADAIALAQRLTSDTIALACQMAGTRTPETQTGRNALAQSLITMGSQTKEHAKVLAKSAARLRRKGHPATAASLLTTAHDAAVAASIAFGTAQRFGASADLRRGADELAALCDVQAGAAAYEAEQAA